MPTHWGPLIQSLLLRTRGQFSIALLLSGNRIQGHLVPTCTGTFRDVTRAFIDDCCSSATA